MTNQIYSVPDKDQTLAFDKLSILKKKIKDTHLNDLFAKAPSRFKDFSVEYDQVVFDFSKQRIDLDTFKNLIDFAHEQNLNPWIKKLFSTEQINYTEHRAAMHWALRLPKSSSEFSEINPSVQTQLERMYALVEKIHAGQFRGATGEVIRQLSELLHRLRPETTLFIISSKSFGTIDTLSNAQTVRQWLEKALGHNEKILQNHFIGVSTKPEKMTEWGIAVDKQLLLWDWVGGRYSLWSCIGLPIALMVGVEGFKQLLAGAYAVDQHFQSAPFHQNIPVLMGLLGAWNNNFLDIQTHAVLPYDGRLKYFAAYLQQLEMESNGKSIQRNGEKVSFSTCPIVWGEVGPNAQHAFYQLLHQGTHSVSCDFIAPVRRYNANQFTYVESADALVEQHHLALSNCLAQSRLLAFGNQALAADELEDLPAYKQYEGNQPSSTILLKELNPYSLGMLIAMYEHKVFVQSVLWNINPFDQWGVEKGKEIANQLLPILNREQEDLSAFDTSTQGLLKILLGKTDG